MLFHPIHSARRSSFTAQKLAKDGNHQHPPKTCGCQEKCSWKQLGHLSYNTVKLLHSRYACSKDAGSKTEFVNDRETQCCEAYKLIEKMILFDKAFVSLRCQQGLPSEQNSNTLALESLAFPIQSAWVFKLTSPTFGLMKCSIMIKCLQHKAIRCIQHGGGEEEM